MLITAVDANSGRMEQIVDLTPRSDRNPSHGRVEIDHLAFASRRVGSARARSRSGGNRTVWWGEPLGGLERSIYFDRSVVRSLA